MRCPFHHESTPSFTVNTTTGQYYCFVPSCASFGNLNDLIKKHTGYNDFEALRILSRVKVGKSTPNLVNDIERLIGKKEEFDVFDPEKIDELHSGLNKDAIEYMASRGISEETLNTFKVGYSEQKKMITIPCYSHNNIPVGVIGRSIEEKRFQYSRGMPIAKVWFNLNRARRESSTGIIVEASMDALKVHQTGYPNVIAILGGNVSDYKMDLINKYFDKIVIMTDNDELKIYDKCKVCKGNKSGCLGHNAGRDAGDAISRGFTREVFWAALDADTIFPRGAKDPGELTENEIRAVVDNAQPEYIYRQNFK